MKPVKPVEPLWETGKTARRAETFFAKTESSYPLSLLFTRFTGSTGFTCCEEGLSGRFPLV
jgi:hypothetical protein